MALVTLCAISVWHAIAAKILPKDVFGAETIEGYVIIGLASTFIVAHLVFILWLYFVVGVAKDNPTMYSSTNLCLCCDYVAVMQVTKRRRDMFKQDKEYKAWLERKVDWQRMANPQAHAIVLRKSKRG
jgi:hypothetical protein